MSPPGCTLAPNHDHNSMDYTAEPTHSDRLDIQQAQPFNAEPSAADLVEFSLTPEELVYCRNHGPVLHFDEETYFVTFKGGEKGDGSSLHRRIKGRMSQSYNCSCFASGSPSSIHIFGIKPLF